MIPGDVPLGAYTKLHDLINLKLAVHRLKLTTTRQRQTGPRRSKRRGRGMDYQESRIYQPGDDVRNIDWRVTARTSITHTKIFHEETGRSVFIVVDQRQSMFFGGRYCCKSLYASHLGALLAWIALQNKDLVGGAVLGNQKKSEVRPQADDATVLKFLREIHHFNNSLKAGPQSCSRPIFSVFGELIKTMNPGSLIFIITDCYDLDALALSHLRQLSRHCEVTLFRVTDLLERELPSKRTYQLTDGEITVPLNLTQKASKNFHLSWLDIHNKLSEQLLAARVRLIMADTEKPILQTAREGIRISSFSTKVAA